MTTASIAVENIVTLLCIKKWEAMIRRDTLSNGIIVPCVTPPPPRYMASKDQRQSMTDEHSENHSRSPGVCNAASSYSHFNWRSAI